MYYEERPYRATKQDYEDLLGIAVEITNNAYMGACPSDEPRAAGIAVEELEINGLYRRQGIEHAWKISTAHFGDPLRTICIVYNGATCDWQQWHKTVAGVMA